MLRKKCRAEGAFLYNSGYFEIEFSEVSIEGAGIEAIGKCMRVFF